MTAEILATIIIYRVTEFFLFEPVTNIRVRGVENEFLMIYAKAVSDMTPKMI